MRQRDRLCGERNFAGIGRAVHDDPFAAAHAASRDGGAAVERDTTPVDPGPEAATRILRQRACERHVETIAGGRGRQRQHKVEASPDASTARVGGAGGVTGERVRTRRL